MSQFTRKVAFSGKKKKDQLHLKRQRKNAQKNFKSATLDSHDDGETTEDNTELSARKLMVQPTNHSSGGRNKNANRYNFYFYQESRKELERLKLECYYPLKTVTDKDREFDTSVFYRNCDFPVRPQWTNNMSKDQLERNENRYFRQYVEQLQHKYEKSELSLFELNLETWRQLWRVLEMSDILLIIVDVRYSTLMFPPALYEYIVKTLKKHAILVLNKVDLVQPEVVVAWRHYFQQHYVDLPVVLFASYPTKALKGTARGRIGHKRSMEGVYNIYRECQKIVQGDINLTSWEQKILEDMRAENICCEDNTLDKPTSNVEIIDAAAMHPMNQEDSQTMYRDGILTVGCIGFPNVGKSSLINALKGRKVVSVSRTPGHTKHFQTIFLTNTMRLCDCPGLVFPSSTPKYVQVLIGSFPIAQLQVPYRSLKFLAEHLNMPKLLKLNLPEDYDAWSAGAIADAWALKRGFLIAKSALPDRYRASNHLLRMCLAGQQGLVLQFYPPDFHMEKEKWLNHADLEEVKKYQNFQDASEEDNDDTSSVNTESIDSDEASSSNDETNDGEETAEDDNDNDEDSEPTPKSRNAFALLEDD